MVVLQTKIEAIKQEKESTAETMIRTQFKMELIVYTQDSTYSCSLSARKEEVQKGHVSTHVFFRLDNMASLHEMMLHLKSYYHVSTSLQKGYQVTHYISPHKNCILSYVKG